MAVAMLADQLLRLQEDTAHGRAFPERFPDRLAQCLQVTNQAIYERGTTQPAEVGRHMGTTLALLLFLPDAAVVAHVGDSRVYRLRDGRIEPLTRDHRVRTTDLEAAWTGRKRTYVTRALGTRPDVAPDIVTTAARVGDRFVLCSDGLTDLVLDQEIEEVIREAGEELANVPRALINLANERGGRDNITVVIASVAADVEDAGAPPPLLPPPVWESADSEDLLA
jgi:protein phosphatase